VLLANPNSKILLSAEASSIQLFSQHTIQYFPKFQLFNQYTIQYFSPFQSKRADSFKGARSGSHLSYEKNQARGRQHVTGSQIIASNLVQSHRRQRQGTHKRYSSLRLPSRAPTTRGQARWSPYIKKPTAGSSYAGAPQVLAGKESKVIFKQ
jgi:hypothetical protein